MLDANGTVRRWGVLLLVVAVTAAIPVSATGIASGAASAQPQVVYAADGELHVLAADGSTTGLGVSAAAVAPARNFDDDGRVEYPYVDGSGALHLVDSEGESQLLVSGGVDSSKTLLATGDWDGDGTPAVFYANTDANGYLYRVEPGSSPERVLDTQVKAVLGVADFDGDGDRDIVFLGSSSTIKYYDGESVSSTGYSSIGANNGLGAGPPVDLNGDGTVRVPVVTGSQTIALVGANGEKTELNANYQRAAKAPVGAADVTGDGRPEIVHVNAPDDALAYVTLDGTTGMVTDAGGTAVSADASVGAIPVAEVVPPEVSAYSVRTVDARTIEVRFEATQQLTEIRVDIAGPESATLTSGDFEEAGDGPYTYTATYDASSEGEYTVALETAANAGGDGATGQSGTVTIDVPEPTVRGATLVDQTDENGVVADGDRVTVTADVAGENLTVRADLTAFGAGTVRLVHQTGSTYRKTVLVDADEAGQDGPHRAPIEATNAYGLSDADTTGSLALDTTAPSAVLDAPYIVTVDESARFEATASTDNVAIAGYEWQFGDGVTSHGMEVTHTFAAPGTYTVSLVVTDAAGHTDTASAAVIVETERGTQTAGATPAGTRARTRADTRTQMPEAAPVDTSVDIETTRFGPDHTMATVTNATAGNKVLVPLAAGGPDTPATLSRVGIVPQRGGEFTVTARSTTSTPGDVPGLGRSRAAAPVAYFTLEHSISNANVASGTMTVTVSAATLQGRDPSHVVLYRYHGGAWRPLSTTLVDRTRAGYRYRARTPGMSAFAVGVQHAAFDVRDVTLGRSSLGGPGPVSITATVANTGEVAGAFDARLTVNGSVVSTRTVSVPAHETRAVTFSRQFDRGTYRVGVSGTEAGVLAVGTGSTVNGRTGAGFGLPCDDACDVVVAGLLAVVLAVSLAVRHRRHEPDVEQAKWFFRNR